MIIAVIVELLISYLILKWILKQKTGEPYSKKKVVKFLLFGALAVVAALTISIVVSIDKEMFFNLNPVLAGFLTALLTAALFEECVKYVFYRLVLIKCMETKSWLDAIIAAVIVGVGFCFVENVEFAITGGANILRAFLPGHILFQFFMGYFYGKARVTGNKKYDVLSVAVPILAHTLYDMPIIALMAAIGDIDALQGADFEALKQLPNFGYFIPLFVCIIAVAVLLIVGLILAAKNIHTWSKNGEKQEVLN